jgi:hypothetical protein
MLAYIMDDFAHARQQPGILKNRLAYNDAIPSQLPSFPEQPGCLGQCSHGNGPVIRRHTPKLVAGHKDGSGTQLCGPECSGQTGWASANDDDVHQTPPVIRLGVLIGCL